MALKVIFLKKRAAARNPKIAGSGLFPGPPKMEKRRHAFFPRGRVNPAPAKSHAVPPTVLALGKAPYPPKKPWSFARSLWGRSNENPISPREGVVADPPPPVPRPRPAAPTP